MYPVCVYNDNRITSLTSLWQSLCQCVPALAGTPHPVIAFVGAGGKTTWIYELAKELRRQGKRVLITTTTKLYRPTRWAVLENDVDRIRQTLDDEGIVITGIPVGTEKITALDDDVLVEATQFADVTLVEADGARHKPCKVFGPHEPVIPRGCHAICALMGMNGIGQTLETACFRFERVPLPVDTVMTPPVLANLWKTQVVDYLEWEYSQIPLVPIIHQAGTMKLQHMGEDILCRLGRQGIISSVPVDVAFIYMAAGFGRRFGRNKLLASVKGQPLFSYGLGHLIDTQHRLQQNGVTSAVYVVSQYDEILQAARDAGVSAVANPHAAEGMAASIRLGVYAAQTARHWAFIAADQPGLGADIIASWIEKFFRSSHSLGAVSVGGKRRGSPAIFANAYKDELLALRGDIGGRDILRRHGNEVWVYPLSRDTIIDIDTPEVLEQYEKTFITESS